MKTYILSTYFTKASDPQRHEQWQPDRKDIFLPWYNGLGEAQGVIFHDGLSPAFINHFSEKVIFVDSQGLTEYSTNDRRFVFFYDYINAFLQAGDRVFMTDLFDVKINKIPEIPTESLKIYVSDECDHVWDNNFTWSVDQMKKCFGGELPEEIKGKQFLNPGVWGGEKQNVSLALSFIMKEFLDRDVKNLNCNFILFNYVLRKYFSSILEIGYPLNSKFNHYEVNSDACFIHK